MTDHLTTNLDDLLIVLKHFNDSQVTLSQFLAVRFDGTIAAPHRNLVGGSWWIAAAPKLKIRLMRLEQNFV